MEEEGELVNLQLEEAVNKQEPTSTAGETEEEYETEKEEKEGEKEGEREGEKEEKGEEEGEKDKFDLDINLTDSQVMIQLKEAEEEAAALRKEITELRREVDDYQCRAVLTEEDEEHLQMIQEVLIEKIALLDELTKRIAKLMEIAGRGAKSEDTTILDEEEEEEGFPDDLLPRVVICSSWDDMMPKVVVCMDMKKPGAGKKKEEEQDRDENGLTPEQREALEQERRCMAEERNRLQYQIACLEGEMRVMMRENDMLSKKVAHLKAEMENQPPFEFEMSVSATNPPGCGPPKMGNIEAGYGVMGPQGPYTVSGTLAPGEEFQGSIPVPQRQPQYPPGMYPNQGMPAYPPPNPQGYNRQGQPGQLPCCGMNPNQGMPAYPPPDLQGSSQQRQPGQLPCGGISGIPGKAVPCPRLQPEEPAPPNPNEWPTSLPPYGKRCRKDFNAAYPREGCCGGMMPAGIDEKMLASMKPPPMDINFKVNVQPQSGTSNKNLSMDADSRSNRIAQQLQEIEAELRRMQRDLCKAKNDKETLRAQQATLNCAKNYIT